jgi:dTDP-4-dehydrorhamnose 3,5-epimerase
VNRFAITDLPLSGLKCIERQPVGDRRGHLARLFCAADLRSAGWTCSIAQINHGYTARKGSVRGLHFQYPPLAEMKLVSCIRGEIFDVAVDLRRGSQTFLGWHGEHLSARNNRALLIPEGFAHGFQTLSDDVELIYCHSVPYNDAAEGGLDPRDPKLGINWPLPVVELSARDSGHPRLDGSFAGLSS